MGKEQANLLVIAQLSKQVSTDSSVSSIQF